MDKGKEAKLFQRLRLRLTLVCTAATGIILIAMALSALAVSESQLADRSEAAFDSSVNAILYHLRSQTVVDHTWISQTEAGGNLKLYLELSGEPLLYYQSESDEVKALVSHARKKALQEYALNFDTPPDLRYQAGEHRFEIQDATGQRHRAAVGQVIQEKGWLNVMVLQSMAAQEQELIAQRAIFGAFVAVALILLALFAWLFTRYAVRPIQEIRRRQTEFIAAASHELRAPLAVVRNCLSATRGTDIEKAEHFTEMAIGECDRMSRLIGDMLSLANADSGTWTIHPAPVEPETLLLEAAEHYERAAHEKGVRLSVTLPEQPLPRCNWDGERILQLLTVLVDNAISYTPMGGTVCLSGTPAGERVRLCVADSGPGVPDGEKEHIFGRFYRGDTARTERTHYGLGLCIAREITELHRGTVAVADAFGGGAVFMVHLPIK